MNNYIITKLLTSADFELEIELQLFIYRVENFSKNDSTALIIS